MSTVTASSISQSYAQVEKGTSFIGSFINWCEVQQENRFLWLGTAIAAHGCVLTPITIFAIAMAGMNLWLFMAALIAMVMTLVVNLAALPTRITIPVFMASILIDVLTIASTILIGLNA